MKEQTSMEKFKSSQWFGIVLMAALVIWRHKENIKRLLSGTERKLGDKKK